MLYSEILLFLTCVLAYYLLFACVIIRFVLNHLVSILYRLQVENLDYELPKNYEKQRSNEFETDEVVTNPTIREVDDSSFKKNTDQATQPNKDKSIKDLCEPSRVFSSEEKQELYDQVRYPISSLKKNLACLKRQLNQTLKTSVKYRKLSVEIREIETKLHEQEKKAARHLFDELNSASDMGSDKFDFHGLHIHEAKRIARETILPKLAFTHEIIIVTGHGRNRPNGKSKLKEDLQSYFIHELRLNCETVAGNDGALRISRKMFTNSDIECFDRFSSCFPREN
jgi:hypothetical protein